MPGLESPLWLFALLGIPLVWWIHRFNNRGVELSVSTILLWKNISQPENKGHRLTTADPLWRQRAIIITVLVFALTAPTLDAPSSRRVNVWFDHSLSMHAIEQNQMRIEQGIQKLLSKLESEEITEATIRSLQDPSRTLQLTPQNRATLKRWLSTSPQAISNSLPSPTPSEHETWLVTDGANNKLQDWADKARIAQVIQVGSATENTTITRLSIRPSVAQTSFTGVVSIANQGNKATTRKLQIHIEEKILDEQTLSLQPSETQHHTFTIPYNSANLISARLLEPKDALTNDDHLSLSIKETKIALTGNCGKPMQALLKALPGIRLSTPTSAALTIACANKQPSVAGDTIWFHTEDKTQQINQLPYWGLSAGQLNQLNLQPAQLLVHIAQTPSKGQPLLTADGIPLISFQSTPKHLMEVRLDIHTPQLTDHPIFPTLVTGFMEYALGQKLLDRIHTVQNPPLQSKLQPKLLHTDNRSIGSSYISTTDLTPYIIIAALILLLLDLLRIRETRQ